MNNSVFKLRQFSLIPPVCSTNKVTCDSLQLVYVFTTTMRAFLEVLGCILVSTIHAPVSVMIYRAITNIIPIHEIYNIHYSLWIMGCITVYLHIEDMAAASEIMIWSLYLGLMHRGTFEPYRNMV